MSMITGLFRNILGRLEREWGKRSFQHLAKKILTTPPLQLKGDTPILLSMLCHRDVIAYLIAVKSLYIRLQQGKVMVINDGSLTQADLTILQYHIPRIQFVDIASISTGACPRGGTWERLVKIVELSVNSYIIQLDADIVVSAPTPEIIQSVRDNRSFLLGTGVGQKVSSALDNAVMVQGWIDKYKWDPIPVGVEAEASLDQLSDAAQKQYVHASSGFAGFARGGFSIEDLEQFSAEMSSALGRDRWSQLGTEQIASNFILANTAGPTVLPFPKYACFEPPVDESENALLHFIGTYRFKCGSYRRRAARFIDEYRRANGTSDA
jgi:hypothetical protein